MKKVNSDIKRGIQGHVLADSGLLERNTGIINKRSFARPSFQTITTPSIIDMREPMLQEPIAELQYENYKSPFVSTLYNIDSRERDYTRYPHSNKFRIPLNKDYNIYSLELVSVTIHASQYIIHPGNNAFYFQEESGETLVAIVPPGNYDESVISSIIQAQLNSTGQSSYIVSIDNENIITVSSDRTGGTGVFNIVPGNNSIYNSLGMFDNYSGFGTYSGNTRINLIAPRAVILSLSPQIPNFVVPLDSPGIILNLYYEFIGHPHLLNHFDISLENFIDNSDYFNNNEEFSLLLRLTTNA